MKCYDCGSRLTLEDVRREDGTADLCAVCRERYDENGFVKTAATERPESSEPEEARS